MFSRIDYQNKLLMLWEPYPCIKRLLERIERTRRVVPMCAHMNVQISYKYKGLLQCITKHTQLGMSVAHMSPQRRGCLMFKPDLIYTTLSGDLKLCTPTPSDYYLLTILVWPVNTTTICNTSAASHKVQLAWERFWQRGRVNTYCTDHHYNLPKTKQAIDVLTRLRNLFNIALIYWKENLSKHSKYA